MTLRSLKKTSSKVRVFDWQHGIKLTLAFVSKPSLDQALARLSPTRGTAALANDPDPSRRAFYKLGLRGWEGFTYGKYAELTGFDIDQTKVEEQVPCNEENALEAMRNLYEFETFLVQTCCNPAAFRELSDEQEKARVENLPSSPAGSTNPGA